MTKLYLIPLLAVLLISSGCTVTEAARKQIEVTAAAVDAYDGLIRATLDGSIDPKKGKPVSKADLVATPASVKELLKHLLNSYSVIRRSAHQLHFAVGGPDPTTLDLKPLKLPE